MYYRAYLNAGDGPSGVAALATVSTFRLDIYDATVGRFRQFVRAWNAGWQPPVGSGKHLSLNGGDGLANASASGGHETGWPASYRGYVAPSDTNLACDPMYATWTSSPAGDESLPINCVNWFEALAFCIWDGGFLPSDAEWEYAAAGGDQQREYPWGSAAPGAKGEYAVFGCEFPNGSQVCMGNPLAPGSCCTGLSNIAPLGTATLGAGRWQQLDLAGETVQWILDAYGPYVTPCVDCAALTYGPSGRVTRGSPYSFPIDLLSTSRAEATDPAGRGNGLGFRCARSP